MVRSITLLATFLFILPCFSLTNTEETSVRFSYDDHQLDRASSEVLQQFLNSLDLESDYMFKVSGHTDDDGSFGYNDQLALKRAESVKAFLIERGVDSDAIQVEAFGERAPLVNNDTPMDHQINRRVTVVFEQYMLENLHELQDKLGERSMTEFNIDPSKRHYLRGAQDCIVKIPADALLDGNGNPATGRVDVRMTEALDLDQFIASNLSTVTDDGRILISGGMMRIEAVDAEGRPLQLDSDQELIITIPSEVQEEGMELFISDSGDTWQETGQAAQRLPEMNLPKRPYPRYPGFERPIYKRDMASKPKKPMEPARPREPNRPRKESYTSTIHWYDFLSKNKIAARDNIRYEQAMVRYDEKVDRFHQKMERYQNDCKEYPMKKVRFQEEHQCWKEKILADSIYHNEVVVKAAWDKHMQRTEKYRELYADKNAEWQAKCDSMMDEYAERLDSLGLADVGNMNRYVFQSNRLGWINCDRFYDVPQAQKFNLVVQDRDDEEEKVYVVFTEIKSMAQLYGGNGVYSMANIPRDEPAMIFAYQVKDGKSQMSYKPMNGRGSNTLEFKPAKFSEIRKVLRDLNEGLSS